MYTLPDVKTASVSGKKVFLRADLDVPLSKTGAIDDDTRLNAWFKTLSYLLEQNATVIIGGKLGRPRGIDEGLSVKPIASWLSQKLNDLNIEVLESKRGDFKGWEIGQRVFLLENLQFYKEEKANDQIFAGKLAALAQVFVNDAFAVCHRENASVVGIPKLLPHFAGFRLQKEIEELGIVLEQPKRPLVVIIGGAKLETKLPLVTKMDCLADYVLVGGKLAQEKDAILQAEREKESDTKHLVIADLIPSGFDITEESTRAFVEIIQNAQLVVWNGPMGKIEEGNGEGTEVGTERVAQAIAESSAHTVVGGGDTLEFLRKRNLTDKFSFCSTGGGAMLAFLSGEALPGIEVLLK